MSRVIKRNPHVWGYPSNVVHSFVLGIKWKLRMSRFRICITPPWHPWAFCAIQDGVQDGCQFKQTPRTPLLFNIEQWFWCQTLRFKVREFIEIVNYGVEGLLDNKIQDCRRLKGKPLIIHTIAIIMVSNAMLSGLRNSLNCLIRVWRD
jgi:hypothetical protein